jgi:predicted DNA-binding ribbon-helix-helix protein
MQTALETPRHSRTVGSEPPRTVTRVVALPDGRRRVRLRAFCWSAFDDIAVRQGQTVDALLHMIAARRGRASLLVAAERFVAAYFHGRMDGDPVRRPGLQEERPLLDEVLDHLR